MKLLPPIIFIVFLFFIVFDALGSQGRGRASYGSEQTVVCCWALLGMCSWAWYDTYTNQRSFECQANSSRILGKGTHWLGRRDGFYKHREFMRPHPTWWIPTTLQIIDPLIVPGVNIPRSRVHLLFCFAEIVRWCPMPCMWINPSESSISCMLCCR